MAKVCRIGARIGEAAGLDDHATELRNSPTLALRDQPPQRHLQIGARRAAEAAVAEQDGGICARAHQRVIDSDGAEFIDDDRSARALLRREKPLEERRLSSAQKAGEHRYRQLGAARVFLSKAKGPLRG